MYLGSILDIIFFIEKQSKSSEFRLKYINNGIYVLTIKTLFTFFDPTCKSIQI